jgi:hypothetical protein
MRENLGNGSDLTLTEFINLWSQILWRIDPFLGNDRETAFPSRQQVLIIKNRQPLLGNSSVNTLPQQQTHIQQQRNCWKRCFLHAKGLYNKDTSQELSVESQAAKRRLGGWCEMTASLGVKSFEALRELGGSCHSERTWAQKQRNSHC